MPDLYGTIEAGGTKIICGYGYKDGTILDEYRFDTTTPEENIPMIVEYYTKNKVKALGVGTFGPADLNKKSATYGYIKNTPKLPWKNCNIKGELEKALGIPVKLETDVNIAMLGEWIFGTAKGLDSALYLTIGTGIGAGILLDGKLVQGVSHPEAGHIILRKLPNDNYEGKCPYHKTCLEGLAAGPAIEARWGISAKELAPDHEAWDMEASYIAQALVDYMLIVSPERIILGGGVASQEHIFPKIREKLVEYMADYMDLNLFGPLEDYIVPASLNGKQALMGGLWLAAN